MEAISECADGALAVTAARVAEDVRSVCLPRYFGMECVVVEAWIFNMMARLCREYDGGYWHYYELSNGGFYMAPDSAESYELAVDGNGFMDRVSADAAGIITCAMVYSHLSFVLRDGRMAAAFHLLRDYIGAHPEARQIFAALD